MILLEFWRSGFVDEEPASVVAPTYQRMIKRHLLMPFDGQDDSADVLGPQIHHGAVIAEPIFITGY